MAPVLNLAKIKQKLKECGLSTTGSKHDLTLRLEEVQNTTEAPRQNISPTKISQENLTTPVERSTRPQEATEESKKRSAREHLDGVEKFSKTASTRREELFKSPSSQSASEETDEQTYPIQRHLNKHIYYTELGQSSKVNEEQSVLFDFIDSECRLPADLSVNKRYGASRSGLSYEERAIAAYAHGLLENTSLSKLAKEVQPAVRKAFVNNDCTHAAALVTECLCVDPQIEYDK